MKFGTQIVALGLFAFAALVAAGLGVDEPFRQHMWVLFFVLLGFLAILIRNTSFDAAAPVDPLAYMDATLTYLIPVALFLGALGLGGFLWALNTASTISRRSRRTDPDRYGRQRRRVVASQPIPVSG